VFFFVFQFPSTATMQKWLSIALVAVLAQAKNCVEYGTASSSFNAVLFGDYKATNTDVEGKMAVGGNFQVSDYSAGLLVPGKCSEVGLIVGGTLSMTRGSISVKSTSKNAPVLTDVNLPCGSPEVRAPPFDFATAKTDIQGLSSKLAAMPTTGSFTQSGKNITFTFGGSKEIEVLNIADPMLFQGQATNILNVAGVRSGNFNARLEALLIPRRFVARLQHQGSECRSFGSEYGRVA
jgi:hypothetical protein